MFSRKNRLIKKCQKKNILQIILHKNKDNKLKVYRSIIKRQ